MNLIEIKERFASGEISKPDYIDRMHELHQGLFTYSRAIRGTDIAKIEITDDTVTMTARGSGIRIVCDKDDKRIAPIEIINFDSYEKDEYSMIMKLIGANDVILDIGANIGWYSINIATTYPSSRIYAFEPIPKTFGYLARNIALNDIKNVRAGNFGLSNQEGDLTFYYYPEGSGNASSANLTGAGNVDQIKCRVITLDQFVATEKLEVNFIKCDVEGAELMVFQGALATLGRCKPAVFTEMLRKWSAKFGYHPNEIIKLFSDLGYRCFTVKGDRLVECPAMDEQTRETNFFFLQEAHIARIEQGS